MWDATENVFCNLSWKLECLDYNLGHNILEIFKLLEMFLLTTSEAVLNI